eukprot:comp17799_c0_seq1/m.17870 comp17799_c0_seq1/g.17870  ORF comp17799_c0_seq1/g.17870 comp17799_c0_seq1/m.17870 type:complete len:129 (-) comp17799_c0_seq1:233-619(-)
MVKGVEPSVVTGGWKGAIGRTKEAIWQLVEEGKVIALQNGKSVKRGTPGRIMVKGTGGATANGEEAKGKASSKKVNTDKADDGAKGKASSKKSESEETNKETSKGSKRKAASVEKEAAATRSKRTRRQ